MTESNDPPNAGPPNDSPRDVPGDSALARKPQGLSADDAAQLAGRLAELAAAELPLAPGLRAAAAELNDGRLADALRSLASGLERGQTLEQALVAEQSRLPANFRGLIAAGVRSGRLGEVLEQFVGFRQFVTDLRRSVWLALAYPLLLLVITAGLFLFLVMELTPLLTILQRDMAAQPVFVYTPTPPPLPRVPENLRVLQWFLVHLSVWLSAVGVAGVLLAILCWFGGSSRVRWVLNRLPAVGPLWRYSGLAEFAQLLRLLVEHGIPLGEALRLTADGIGDADVAVGCRRLAERVESGQPLSFALDGLSQFAPIEHQLIAWGESHGSLAAALETMVELCVRRLHVWSELLRRVLPPAMFLVIATGVLLVVSFFQATLASWIALLSGSGVMPTVPEIDFGQPAGTFSLALIGIVLLISLRLMYSNRPSGGDALHLVLQIVARIFLAYAAYGLFLIAAAGWGVFLWFAAMILWGMIVFRFRRSQQRMLLDLLALSARRGLPLGPVVQAFAEEQPGAIGRRATEFSARLQAGYPVPEAIRATRRLLPPQDQLAIEIGQQTDSLPVTLEGLGGERNSAEHYKEEFGVGLIGLLAVSTWGAAAVLIFAFKIVPSFVFIFREFHQTLPPLTQELFSFLRVVDHPWLPLEIVFAIGLVIAGFYLPMYVMGWTRAELPPINRLFAPRHTAVVLRWLAAAVRRQQSLWPMLSELALRYPSRLIRSRLRSVTQEVEEGGDWIASFRRRRLICRTDVAVLRAASRAGNLAWALEEAAAAAQRRLAYRLQAISQILMPLAILLAGGFVMLFGVGCLLPLVTLISELAKR